MVHSLSFTIYQVSNLVRSQLIERARDFFIILDDVSIVSFAAFHPPTPVT